MHSGVTFPSDSTTRTAQRIVVDALTGIDPDAATRAADASKWRRDYLDHFVTLVRAGLPESTHAVGIARQGLASARDQMQWEGAPLDSAFDTDGPAFGWTTIHGTAVPAHEFALPYRGRWLTDGALLLQLEQWERQGVVSASCARAVAEVQAHPEWLGLAGDTVVVLGAGSEMGPYRTLLRWGADVVAVDLPRPHVQHRLVDQANAGAGRVRIPVRTDSDSTPGGDLLHELPALGRALTGLGERLVLGNYTYADGGTHVRLSMAADALGRHLVAHDPDTALAFLATPTDAFAVPVEDVEAAREAYAHGSRLLRTPAQLFSAGHLMQPNYRRDDEPAICDSLVPQQGPNYALAKRLQRWRATEAAADGQRVSLNVAPATRTHSVLKNRALAAAYAGAHRFGIEVFEPATSNVLMAALLVHDLRAGRTPSTVPWQEEAHGAAHGGLWTAAYHARSALGLAAVLGIGSARP